MHPQLSQLLDAAARPYGEAGMLARHFARGKLRHDPVYLALLRRGLLPDQGSLVDLGCGQGLLLSLLNAAKTHLALHGVDSHAGRVRLARRALGNRAQIDLRGVSDFDFRPCTVIVLVDVLLYLDEAEQARVLDKSVAALEPGGLLLLREADASAGLAYLMTRWSARFDAARRGSFAPRLRCRSAADWTAELTRRGFAVDAAPMSEGTPFANVLFVARKVV
jgi:trans-aconitate methyltransferase